MSIPPTTERSRELMERMDEIEAQIEAQLRPTLLSLVKKGDFRPEVLGAPRETQVWAASRRSSFKALLDELHSTNLSWNIEEGLY